MANIDIDAILNKNERVLWKEKPVFWPFMFGSLCFSIFIGFLSIPAFIPLFFFDSTLGAFMYLFMVGSAVFLAIFLPLLYNYLAYRITEYAITDKRVIAQGGVIGRDFNSIEFDKIKSISANVGIGDKLLGDGTGTLMIRAGGLYGPMLLFRSIRKPYDLYKKLKKITFDINADIQFPTEFRPRRNRGYNTRYEPSE